MKELEEIFNNDFLGNFVFSEVYREYLEKEEKEAEKPKRNQDGILQ